MAIVCQEKLTEKLTEENLTASGIFALTWCTISVTPNHKGEIAVDWPICIGSLSPVVIEILRNELYRMLA